MTTGPLKITDFTIQNGSITFHSAVEARPESTTSETNGNVTINNIMPATPGLPASFEANFPLRATYEVDGVQFQNWFTVESRVTGFDHQTPYRVAEDAAARQLPTILRLLADEVEKSFSQPETS